MISLEDYSKSLNLIYKLFPKWIRWFYDMSLSRGWH